MSYKSDYLYNDKNGIVVKSFQQGRFQAFVLRPFIFYLLYCPCAVVLWSGLMRLLRIIPPRRKYKDAVYVLNLYLKLSLMCNKSSDNKASSHGDNAT